MSLRFEPYTDALVPAAQAFNARLDAAGMPAAFRLASTGDAERFGASEGAPVRSATFLAVDEESAVRGGISLHFQSAIVGGESHELVNVQLPLSEGWFDKQYAFVAMWLVKSVLQRHPMTYAVGMGGMDQAFPKLLVAMRWQVASVPFYFHVHQPRRFLRGMPRLRQGSARALAADVAAFTGAGWLGLRVLERVRADRRAVRPSNSVSARCESDWGPWADAVWQEARATSSMIGVRDHAALRLIYPPGDRYHVVRVVDGARDVGWAVLLSTAMRDNQYFGNLQVGTILDALCIPGYELAVARAARTALDDLRVDISVSNHAHLDWQQALRAVGYLAAPSNFLLAMSKRLTDALARAPIDAPAERVHVTRGDGDGRIHL